MAKYNRQVASARASQTAFRASKTATGTTHEGATGYVRNAKTELFLRAASSFAGENSYYEKGKGRDKRLIELTRGLAVTEDGFEWLGKFVPWLRNEGFMRSGPVMIAAEAVNARLAQGLAGGNRQLIASAMARADEPGEMTGYWISRFGRTVPISVKRGIGDAAIRLYTERSLLKWDTPARAYRFGDVIELSHPSPKAQWQDDLFKYAIDRRHRPTVAPESLTMVTAQAALMRQDAEALLDEDALDGTGMTWEKALSAAGKGADKAKAWEAVIPQMGYMALLRNLRNFDDAGVSDEVAARVCAKLSDPDEVARSMQFPFRFLSAYREVNSVRWHQALELAANHAVRNIPELTGKNLVLIDTSGSMTAPLSEKSKITNIEAAALFGAATGIRTKADIWSFASGQLKLPEVRGSMSVLKYAAAVQSGPVGHGTEMNAAINKAYDGHDRVFIFSDMQAFGYYANQIDAKVPASVPVYAFNLSAYTHTPFAGASKRVELGGLGDATFRLIPLIEAGQDAKWPWEM